MAKKLKQKHSDKEICFLITPIGADDSAIRKRVNQWKDMVYEPALGDFYEIVRADNIASPGVITEQIIEHIINADLVVIDYTGLNPNVMYEAAIRHLTEKPYIQIHEIGTFFPFDIHNLRSIPYDPTDLKYPDLLIQNIKNSLKEIQNPKNKQAKFVREKFDFNKIVNDPEKFVQLLREHIVPSVNQGKEESIVMVADYQAGNSLGIDNKVVCPNCKTIKYTDLYSFGMYSSCHYKCNVCGIEFEK